MRYKPSGHPLASPFCVEIPLKQNSAPIDKLNRALHSETRLLMTFSRILSSQTGVLPICKRFRQNRRANHRLFHSKKRSSVNSSSRTTTSTTITITTTSSTTPIQREIQTSIMSPLSPSSHFLRANKKRSYSELKITGPPLTCSHEESHGEKFEYTLASTRPPLDASRTALLIVDVQPGKSFPFVMMRPCRKCS